jgi:ABC-type multidrug transport system ATPase subunit
VVPQERRNQDHARTAEGARVTASDPIITVEGVEKSFGSTRALAGVDLAVTRGTVLGLLGRNGAGKTTLVRILATLLAPDAGRVRVAGADVVRRARMVRSLIGFAGAAGGSTARLNDDGCFTLI